MKALETLLKSIVEDAELTPMSARAKAKTGLSLLKKYSLVLNTVFERVDDGSAWADDSQEMIDFMEMLGKNG